MDYKPLEGTVCPENRPKNGSCCVCDVGSRNKNDSETAKSAAQIISSAENHTLSLNDEELAKILLNQKIAEKKVAVVSVAGAFRKGKSFLLNLFLRFLHSQQKGLDAGDWLNCCTEEANLEGFSWRGGSERDTNGILVWKRVFLLNVRGEEVAVILMDTQGAFDSQSTVKECATIFALSTMISSLQIYNLSQNIQEDDLQHLQLFAEYGRLALENSEHKPFQVDENRRGGELEQLRVHIKSCFADIRCFLMPHPGLKVATDPQFKGHLRDVDEAFKSQVAALTSDLFSSTGLLVPKQINGQRVTCRELLEYFRAYVKIFQGEELPEPKSILQICGGDTPFLATEALHCEHERCQNEAVSLFNTTKKMGGSEFSLNFLEKLNAEITECYENFDKANKGKNVFKSMRTPAVLFLLVMISYVAKELFELLGAATLASTLSSTLILIAAIMMTWAYVRYSGQGREIGFFIDELAEWIWQNTFAPLSKELLKKMLELNLHGLVGNDRTAITG